MTVNSIPPSNPAPNTASTTYEFTVDPSNPPVSSTATSNTTLLQINNATIISTKTADLTFADVGNTITFTLNLPNTGNTLASNVTIIDILDSNLSFVPNSFTVNGQTIPNADLSTGVNIGSINGGNAAIVTFKQLLLHFQHLIPFLTLLLSHIIMSLILASHLLQLPINLIQRQHKLIALPLLHKKFKCIYGRYRAGYYLHRYNYK